MIIGVDAGGSAVKLALMDGGEAPRLTHYAPNSDKPVSQLIRETLDRAGIPLAAVSRIALTGMHTEHCDADALGIAIQSVPELDAIAIGGTRLARRQQAIVVSIGTGTAYVLARDGQYTHLGGTGMGGGTLMGLAGRLFGIQDPLELDALTQGGDLNRVDLTIGDLFGAGSSLPPELVAANLAKPTAAATDRDWAAGLINLVLQVAGSMAVIACGGHGVSTVILTGALTQLSMARSVYEKFQRVYGLEFIIPPYADCATAIGAASVLEGRP